MINIPNYKMIRLDRESGNTRNNSNKLNRGGGLLFYVHERIAKYTSFIHDCSKISYSLEKWWISIDKPGVKKCIIGDIYMPPASDVNVTVKELSSSMDHLQTNSKCRIYIVLGDLNINYNRRDLKGFKLL